MYAYYLFEETDSTYVRHSSDIAANVKIGKKTYARNVQRTGERQRIQDNNREDLDRKNSNNKKRNRLSPHQVTPCLHFSDHACSS